MIKLEKKENRGGARKGAGRPKVKIKKLTREKPFSSRFTYDELQELNRVLAKAKGKTKSDKILEIFRSY